MSSFIPHRNTNYVWVLGLIPGISGISDRQFIPLPLIWASLRCPDTDDLFLSLVPQRALIYKHLISLPLA